LYIFLKVLSLAGSNDVIRGFATNTAKYQPLGTLTSTGLLHPSPIFFVVLCFHLLFTIQNLMLIYQLTHAI
jgi:hypothetical protein